MAEKGQKREKKGQDAKPETMDPSPGPGDLVQCWRMELTGTTAAGLEVSAQKKVQGTPAGARVMVLAERVGTLGYAPPVEAAQIMDKLGSLGGGTLAGTVVRRDGTSLEVELCLYRR